MVCSNEAVIATPVRSNRSCRTLPRFSSLRARLGSEAGVASTAACPAATAALRKRLDELAHSQGYAIASKVSVVPDSSFLLSENMPRPHDTPPRMDSKHSQADGLETIQLRFLTGPDDPDRPGQPPALTGEEFREFALTMLRRSEEIGDVVRIPPSD